MNETLNTLELNHVLQAQNLDAEVTLSLDGFDISNGNIKVSSISDSIDVALNSYDIPQNNGRGFLSNFKRGRDIRMTIYIRGDTKEEFQENLDAFRKVCFRKNIVLEDKRSGTIRRLVVNCTSSPLDFRHYNLTFLKFDVNFVSLEPFWYELEQQSTIAEGMSSSFVEEIETNGTARSELITYIVFTSSSATQVKLSVGDDEMIIDRNFSDGEVLQINGETLDVLVDGNVIDYTGGSVFPFLESGQNFVNVDILGSFTADVLFLNKNSYV